MTKTTSEYVIGHTSAAHEILCWRNASNSCDFFTHLIQPHYRILDAGCGPGSISASLAPFVPNGSVTGVDLSEAVVAKASQQSGLPSNCSFQVANLTNLPFPDNSFDVVYTSQTLIHIPAVSTVMQELRRVCRVGGFVACKEGDLPAALIYPPLAGIELFKRVMTDMMEKTGCHATGGRMLISWALAAGFSVDSVSFSVGGLDYCLDKGRHAGYWARWVLDDQAWRQKAIKNANVTESDFELMSADWKEHARCPDALFSFPCGQLVAHKT